METTFIGNVEMFDFFLIAFIYHLEMLGSSIISLISHTIGNIHLFIYSNWPHATFCSTYSNLHSYTRTLQSDYLFRHLFSISFLCARISCSSCMRQCCKRMNAERREKKQHLFNLKLEVIELSLC